MDTTKTPESQEVLRMGEAAKFLGVSYVYLADLVKRGKVPHKQLGDTMKSVRFYKPALIAMLEGKA